MKPSKFNSALAAAGRGRRNLVRTLLTLAALAACAHAAAVAANAQDTCVPQARGVPGNRESPPNWYDPAVTAPARDRFDGRIDDPRWVGSVQQSYGSGTASQVEFRMLHSNLALPGTNPAGQERLYMSWNIKVSPALTINDDNRLFVGFSPGGGQEDVIISIQLNNAAPGTAPTSNYTAAVLTKPAASPGTAYTAPMGGVPAWVTDRTRMWVNNVPSNTWAVHMVVPVSNAGLASGINLGQTFKMWYELRVSYPMNPTPPPPPEPQTYILYRWPRNAPFIDVDPMTLNDKYPETSAWGNFRLTSGNADAPDPLCPTNGVTMRVQDIGIQDPSDPMNLSPTTTVRIQQPNVWVARPTYNSPSPPAPNPLPVGGIHAKFYIANWGSQIGDEDPDGPGSSWVPLRLGEDVPSTGTPALGAQADIRFTLQFNNVEKAPFENGTKNPDQCLLVKLFSPLNLTFLNDSVRRNMMFQNMSKMRKKAEISVRGLPALSTPKRDVYLYVETANMPAKVDPVGQPTHGATPRQGGTTGTRVREFGELDPFTPTYRVHAYHDTGNRVKRNGTTYILLRPQDSFGYYLLHDGPLEGWRHKIEGAQKLGDDYHYRIPVPNNGAAEIVTEIEAVEPGESPTPTPQPPDVSKFSIGLRAGVAVPHGTFGSIFDPGFSFNGDVEYDVNNNFSAQVLFGYHRFEEDFFGGHLDNFHLSANGKVYGGSPGGSVRPFINFGGGVYHFRPSQTNGGVNVGGGLQFNVTPRFAFEGAYNFHNVFTPGFNARFSTVQGGVRFRF